MAYLGSDKLKEFLKQPLEGGEKPIEPFESKRIIDAHYEMALGEEVYVTNSKTGKTEILSKTNKTIDIKPGQFALLLTQETVIVPKDKLAFISINATQKFKGLINVSGFHVDPGWSGKLLFSVYNAGASTITLETGKPYFPIWFSNMIGEGNYNGKHKGQDSIPSKHIEALKGNLASPNVLLDRIKSNENKLLNFTWVATLIIGLGITLTVKALYDFSRFDDGFEAGMRAKEVKEEIQSANIDKMISSKVDSVLRAKGIAVKNATE
jgi:dCTP deaminase